MNEKLQKLLDEAVPMFAAKMPGDADQTVEMRREMRGLFAKHGFTGADLLVLFYAHLDDDGCDEYVGDYTHRHADAPQKRVGGLAYMQIQWVVQLMFHSAAELIEDVVSNWTSTPFIARDAQVRTMTPPANLKKGE